MRFATVGKPGLYVEIEFTGPSGLAEAIEPVHAALFWRYRDHLAELSQMGITRRVVMVPGELDEFRATQHGGLAKLDAREKRGNVPLDFLLKRRFFDGRPDVESHGRLLRQVWDDEPARGERPGMNEPSPTDVYVSAGPSQAASSTGPAASSTAGVQSDQSQRVLSEILREVSGINSKLPASGIGSPSAEPFEADSLVHPEPLGKSEQIVLCAMASADPTVLLSITEIRNLIADPSQRRSRSIICSAVDELIRRSLAERPRQPRLGARITTKGRRLVRKISP